MVVQEPSILTQELLLPALRLVEAGRRREDELRRRIGEKDRVVGKLMDKLEAVGADLSMVFPGFVGARRGLSARQAGRVVPGLEAFSEDEWERMVEGGGSEGVKGIVDGLRDAVTGELVWRRAAGSSTVHLDGKQSGEETHRLGQEAKDNHQVRAVVSPVRKYSLTSLSENHRNLLLLMTIALQRLKHQTETLLFTTGQALLTPLQPRFVARISAPSIKHQSLGILEGETSSPVPPPRSTHLLLPPPNHPRKPRRSSHQPPQPTPVQNPNVNLTLTLPQLARKSCLQSMRPQEWD